MATDATGTPTSPDNIPTYNTAVDAPSGKGFNAAMAAIQTALNARVSAPAGIATGEVPVWNGTTWARSTTTRISASSLAASPSINTFLRGDSSWQKGGLNLLWDSADAGVTFPTASITTPTLDASFKNLLIVWSALQGSVAAASDNLVARINGDVGGDYYYQEVYANNSALGAAGASGGTSIVLGPMPAASAAVSGKGGGFSFIPGYSTTGVSYKQIISCGSAQWNVGVLNLEVSLIGGAWLGNQNPIQTVTFFGASGGLSSGRISIYGI